MEREEHPWPAARIVHLVGGGRVVNEQNPTAYLVPDTPSGKRLTFRVTTYRSLYNEIHSLGLKPVGVDFYSHQLEVEGKQPPNWRPYLRPVASIWCCEDSAQIWAQIANGAFRRKMAQEWDLAGRIQYQLSALSWRLREVSEAYHRQVLVRISLGDFKDRGRFEDGFTNQIYLALHSCLIDACILRDYLAEFMAQHVFIKSRVQHGAAVRTMASLRKKVLKRLRDENELAATLWDATDEATGGWLAQLGAYRDLIVHASPLAHAESRLFAVSYLHPVNGERQLPAVYCPVPADPIRVKTARSTANHFKSFEDLLEVYLRMARQEDQNVDGLTYVWEAVGHLSSLAELVAHQSRVPPERITLTEDDLIGPIKIITGK